MPLTTTTPATKLTLLATLPRNEHQWVRAGHNPSTRWHAPMKQKITQSIMIGVLILISLIIISLMPEQQPAPISKTDSVDKPITTASTTIERSVKDRNAGHTPGFQEIHK